ncbi:MAG TPA: alpha/beta hydrolase [Solirubrobacteraceae bacterium]|jgi:pimeloyl-ACP methyl ester carboxylesterase
MTHRRLRLAIAATTALLVAGGVTSAASGPATAAGQVGHADSGPVAHADQAATLRVGSVTLRPCTGGFPGYCGHIERPLDPGLKGTPRIPIEIDEVPARDRNPHDPTIVAVEGGPGYPSSGTYAEYLGTFRGAMAHHNLLMVDNRGTGRSAVIRCRQLQRYHKNSPAYGPVFDRLVGDCATKLDREYHTASGTPIHAADLFATEYAVTDLHVALDRLHTGKVTLYGDSYGSWFSQAFMARYPDQLRAVILDSTYAVHDLDPWYGSSGLSGRAAMDRVCARSLACRVDAGHHGSPVSRLARLLDRVRHHPIGGTVLTNHGPVHSAITPTALVNLFQDGGSDPYPWRVFDASVRAALTGDPTPMLRSIVDDNFNGGVANPLDFGDGDYMAVSCTDYPQLFSLDAPEAQRPAQYRQSLGSAPPGVFRPFTAAEWVTMSGYSETYDACLDWPVPVHSQPMIAPVGPRRLPASVPLLIVGGDLDDLTPLHDARRFGPTLGRDVRVVDLHNTVHVTSEGDTYLDLGARCVRSIIDRFVLDPEALQTMSTRCAARIPPLQTPGAYPRSLGAARPASIISGPPLSLAGRRAVTVAAGALADATIRFQEFLPDHGVGLYGGTWRFTGGDRYVLSGIRFTTDSSVTGAGSYRPSDGATAGTLTVRGRRLAPVTVSLDWDVRSQFARARVGATALTLPAP